MSRIKAIQTAQVAFEKFLTAAQELDSALQEVAYYSKYNGKLTKNRVDQFDYEELPTKRMKGIPRSESSEIPFNKDYPFAEEFGELLPLIQKWVDTQIRELDLELRPIFVARGKEETLEHADDRAIAICTPDMELAVVGYTGGWSYNEENREEADNHPELHRLVDLAQSNFEVLWYSLTAK